MANLVERQIGPGPVPVWDIQTASAGQIDACCGLGRGVNLFDNWWFGIGAINQRGKTTYPASTVASYGIDRWFMASSSTITWESDGLLIDGNYIGQVQDPILREYLTGKVVTMSALVKGNAGDIGRLGGTLVRFSASSEFQLVTTTFTYGGGSHTANSPIISPVAAGAPIKVLAMGLEIGPVSTLAHKEGDTWVLNSPPPNYGMELIKCRRYYRPFCEYGLGIAKSTSSAQIEIIKPLDMRSTPTPIPTYAAAFTPNGWDTNNPSNIQKTGENSNVMVFLVTGLNQQVEGTHGLGILKGYWDSDL